MKDEDIKLCSTILEATKGFRETNILTGHILDKIYKEFGLGSPELIRGINLLKEAGLMTATYTEKGHPSHVQVTPKGQDVRDDENGFEKLAEQVKVKEQIRLEKEQRDDKIKDLQLEELEIKVKHIEKQFKEQHLYWKRAIVLSILALVLSAASFYYAIIHAHK